MSDKQFGIHFGALADPIEVQLVNQGFTTKEQNIADFKRLDEARLNLLFGDCITSSENDKIMKKIFNKLKKSIIPID